MNRVVLLLSIIIGLHQLVNAQQDDQLVQFSGIVMDAQNLQPVPYANVFDVTSRRGTYSDEKGFFTIVAAINDTVQFSFIGYQTVDVIIPDTLQDQRYSVIQLLTRDAINLPETVIFPWPSKEHFDIEFLAMNVTDPLEEAAAKNVKQRTLRKLAQIVEADGDENADFYLRQQAKQTYYQGQAPPLNIFNPLAWRDFIKSWKDGDFKRKRRDDE